MCGRKFIPVIPEYGRLRQEGLKFENLHLCGKEQLLKYYDNI
jgi:hypothetical protein